MNTKGSILIIDDEESLRKTLTRILQKAECNVTSASEGQEALRLIASNNFDLVFLDLRLPDMHGLEMMRELRQLKPKLPVVVLTGYGSMTSALEAMHLEATDYLLKPIDPEILIARTKLILKSQAVEKRKKEIQEQISSLQTELAELDRDSGDSANLIKPSTETVLSDSRFVRAGPFNLDITTRRAYIGESVINLPPASFDYFVVLARYAPEVVRYQTLVVEAQGYEAEFSESRELSKWHIHVLRQSIELDPKNPRFILNVRGVGYQLAVD